MGDLTTEDVETQRYPQEMKVRNLVWGNGEHLAAVKEEFGEIDFLLGSSVCYDEDSSIPLLETIMALSTPAEFEDCSSVEASAEATQGSEDVPTHFEPRVLKRGTITILVFGQGLGLIQFLEICARIRTEWSIDDEIGGHCGRI